mmetsp:Transcript_74029/g.154361  ORF Transcript_74029/g.154361 Transcript_74029/m.154361 type:complete len:377 (-) Transcript_74029:2016-3146(-)
MLILGKLKALCNRRRGRTSSAPSLSITVCVADDLAISTATATTAATTAGTRAASPHLLGAAGESGGTGVLPASHLRRASKGARSFAATLAFALLSATLAITTASFGIGHTVESASTLGSALLLATMSSSLVLDKAFIVLHSQCSFVCKGQGQALKRSGLGMLHQEVLGGLVPECSDFLLDHHLGDDGVDLLRWQIEHADQLIQVESIVDRSVGKEVGSESLDLHLLLDHGLDLLAVLNIPDIDVVPQLEGVDSCAGALPVSSLKCLGCADHSLLCILRRPSEDLLVVMLQRTAQDLGDHVSLAGGVDGLESQVRHFQKHGAYVVGTVQHLQIDVHVVWQLSQTFIPLLLLSLLLELAERQTLCQQFSALTMHADVH